MEKKLKKDQVNEWLTYILIFYSFFYMQRLRQQSFIKIQLPEWKKDEELSKGAVFELFIKLQRPKSVD